MDFDWNVIWKNREVLVSGMMLSLKLFAIALTGGIFFGTLLAMARLSSWKVLSYPAAGFVNLIRSIPFIMAIFWFYFLTPMLVQKMTGQQGEAVGPFTSAIVAFIMVESAYYSEIIRAGIQSIPRGQPWAAYALGMNYWQAMGTVVLPQAFRNMIPIMLTQAIILFQDTSLVYVVGLKDFLGAASKAGQLSGRIVELYIFVAFVFFIICFGASWAVKKLQAKYAIVR
ncbi:Glutamate/aspartate import permease protein GltK [Usitatibacter rugosus]|uniref:Glutamate/aspartate import permease protein GltK n=1 Tax=Usitatibacter rugosus TaxID=2732067 RepID=A0A6M4GVS1_9PROT|nr:ABC transporter permease subunit [Usitatibacter rugosus]QJR11391.1 Glutamate/aspartate import permease protein GltK [Usitatibacter rugosus]